MKVTNRLGLPDAIVEAVTFDRPRDNEIRATALVGPPMIRKLTLEHFDEIEEDVVDRLWAILGTAMHGVLAEHASLDSLSEELLRVEVRPGLFLTGHPDLYLPDGSLWDWKFTSKYSLREGPKPEWVAQLNVYAWLLRQHGFEVRALRNFAVYRDWTKRDKLTGVPPAQIFEIPLWTEEEQLTYIEGRLIAHGFDDNIDPPFCSPAERWEKPAVFAVMAQGRKTALKRCATREEAEAFIEREAKEPRKCYIEERPGESTRCVLYCSVRSWCPYGSALEVADATEE